ncbi:MAG TPA: CHAD domain-containing protein [Thermoanaerobaculia bacterium]|nr:CHAD domain-containing protein [Thermoanaerobaculia bacterium]
MAKRANLWRERRRTLKKALAAFRGGHPEGLHDVRVALRRVAATASGLQEESVARHARRLVRSLSERRQLEVDRHLLSRVRELGVLAPEVAAGLDARWDALLVGGARAAEKAVTGRRMRALVERLGNLESRGQGEISRRLQRAHRQAERSIAHPPDGTSDSELHRYRLSVKTARYVLEDLSIRGAPGLAPRLVSLRGAQEALGRWNDVRLFSRRLSRTRRDAERRGAVTLALELDRLLAALDRTVQKARADALRATRPFSNVVDLKRKTA